MKAGTMEFEKVKEIKQATSFYKKILNKKGLYIVFSLIVALISFLAARCTVINYCNPFALAIASAAPAEFVPAAVIGAAAGYLSAGYEIIPLRYICALLIVIISKRLFFRGKLALNPLSSGICALISSALTGTVASLMADEIELTLIPYTFEAFITGICAVILASSAESLRNLKSLNTLKDSEKACVLISAFIIILSISYINIYSFNISQILAVFVILLSAYYAKISGGAVSGIIAGSFLALGQADIKIFMPFALGGLLAGLGMAYNRFFGAVSMGVGFLIPFIFKEAGSFNIISFAQIGIGALAFMIIPKKALKKLRFFNAEYYSVSSPGFKGQAVSRLRFAADAMGDVSKSVDKVHSKLLEYGVSKKSSVYLNTMNNTCAKCGLKYYCWEHEKERTVSCFKKIEKMLENDMEISKETLPDDFGAVCIKSDKLIKNFTLAHTAYTASALAERKNESIRKVMTVQFDALSELLYELSDDIENKEILDSTLTDSLCDLLEYIQAEYDCAGVTGDGDFRLKVSIRTSRRQKVLESEEFLKDINDICSRSFMPANITKFENTYLISFYEKPVFETETGFCQLNADNSSYCGDAFEIITDFFGKSAIILSDGMGKGNIAGINGTLAANILAKLLNAGFSIGAAIKVVNAALLTKGSDESFATVDIVSFDLFGGKAKFVKAGATCSFFKRGNNTGRIELSSMPIGILDNADFASTSVSLHAGDLIVMLSDGATQGNSEWIEQLIACNEYKKPSDLARAIAQKASKEQYGVHEDDITVIVMFIK